MLPIRVSNLPKIILVALLSLPVCAQSMRVEVGKRATTIPKSCESVTPASLADPIDTTALRKEAICKGAGDMLIEYTYVMHVNAREKDKKGNTKVETTTYEVFIPTLKSGMHTRGILLVTNRNGVPVPPDELEKERLRTGERLEKEENKIARAEAAPLAAGDQPKGMLPVGMYTHIAFNRATLGIRRAGVGFAVDDFLETCDLTLLRRAQNEGREVLVFRFTPETDAQFGPNEKYIAQLTGEIWIDAKDRIATKLIAWPRDPKDNATAPATTAVNRPPAVYAEMMRLRDGTWLPRVIRINGADYPTLFDHITTDITWTYSNYVHFSTEVEDYKMKSTDKP
jgi:hypothetical protein